jgi:ABC-2 type transport system ATP-binding protein
MPDSSRYSFVASLPVIRYHSCTFRSIITLTTEPMHVISADSLTKVYQSGIIRRSSVQALNKLSLDVSAGEIFSLLGPNGAGKTTFVKILLSIAKPTSGSALINGMKVPHPRSKDTVGYLPENHRYPGYLSGEDVLRLFGKLSGVSGNTLESRITTLLERVGLSQWRKMKVRKYSKGMMQRLGLAQALVNDPDVLFLDEPTDGVDPVGRKEIREILIGLKTEGKTIFLNSHLLSEVEIISDRVAILDKGTLLRIGTVQELTTSDAQYVIGFQGALPEGFQEEARALVLKLNVNGRELVADLKSTAELNRVIDLLRKHAVEITHIHQKKSTLEESFINLIKKEVVS